MIKAPQISVIVPVYNTEKYLRKCLDTLLNQIYENLEFILVNDGSTDGSGAIIEEYAQKDNRVRAFSRRNSGPGAVRNFGITEARGEYVSFIDSDDWVLLTLYSDFVDRLNKIDRNVDIYVFNACSYARGENDVIPKVFYELSDWNNHDSEYTLHTLSDCQRPFSRNLSAANKIYRKEFLTENDITFPETVVFEDAPFCVKSYLRAESISLTDKIYYKYRNDVQSSRSFNVSEQIFDIFAVTDMIESEIEKLGLSEQYKYALFQYKYLSFLMKYSLCPVMMRSLYYTEMKNRLLLSERGLNKEIACRLRDYNIFEMIKRMSFEEFEQTKNRN